MLEKLTKFLEKSVQPVAVKMSNMPVIQGISQGMLGILCITVGASLTAILVNLPIPAWVAFMQNIGIYQPARELVAATTSLLGIYSVISVAYSYSSNLGQNPRSNVLLAVAVFIILMPNMQWTLTPAEVDAAGKVVKAAVNTPTAYLTQNFGANGIFTGILIGVFVPMLYNYLLTHGVRLKMPDSVPPMVVEAMNPIFAAMCIFAIVLGIKWGVSMTSFGNVYDMVFQILTVPTMMGLGATPITVMVYCMFRAVFWFFGIHPAPLNAMYQPLLAMAVASNIEAFNAGQPMPYKVFVMVAAFGMIGGTGSTYGMNLLMFLVAKSERYKALRTVAIVPSTFNINEPLVFGVPMMYNPLMLIPSLLAPMVGTGICVLFSGIIALNPAVTVAWVVPQPILGFLQGGIWFCVAILVTIVAQAIVYWPFFKICDDQAYAEEQKMAA